MKTALKYSLLLNFTLFSSATLAATTPINVGGQRTGIINPAAPQYASNQVQYQLDLGWESKYISEGRNNLDNSGIYTAAAAAEFNDITLFAAVGRADNAHYTEWNWGVEYALELAESLEASIGYQRIEAYGDERENDNEIFSSIAYTATDWLVPSINYTYSTSNAGYFVEVSLHSHWQVADGVTLTPYITQAFDFQYATEEHDGQNHFLFGLEAEYDLGNHIIVAAQISHSLAQSDIKNEAEANGDSVSLNQTYSGINLSWGF